MSPDVITYLHAALLGIVQGLTEFLPVSSTAHLLITGRLIGFQGSAGGVFEVAIQSGSVLAIIVAYWRRLWPMVAGFHNNATRRHEVFTIILGFVPALVAGFFLHDFVKETLFNSMDVIALALILGGIAIFLIEKFGKPGKVESLAAMPLKTAFLVGLCQCLALIPGVSRSGATIMGALVLGLERKTATEFSFFLAVPTLAAATAYDIYKNYASLTADAWELLAIGFVFAYLAAWVVAKTLIGFVSKHGFGTFAMYRILIGVALFLFLI